MVLRFLMRFLLNDKVIDKLADSYAIRRAAKWTLYLFTKVKSIGPASDLLNEPPKKSLRNLSSAIEGRLKRLKEDLEKKAKQ
jgi:hypothetical protein